jgi:riboflavin transporter FmnP
MSLTIKKISTKQLSVVAVFSALAVLFGLYVRFPILPAVPFLMYEGSDIPILIISFIFGPLSGIVVAAVVALVKLIILGDNAWGVLMFLIASGVFSGVSGLIYKRKHSFKGALIALSVGYLAFVAVMIPLNLIITPIYTGMPASVIIKELLGYIVAFNAIKGVISISVTLLVYKRVHRLIESAAAGIKKQAEKRTANKSVAESEAVEKPDEPIINGEENGGEQKEN